MFEPNLVHHFWVQRKLGREKGRSSIRISGLNFSSKTGFEDVKENVGECIKFCNVRISGQSKGDRAKLRNCRIRVTLELEGHTLGSGPVTSTSL